VSGVIGYDELGRKTSETVNYGAFSKTYGYSYDPQGNKASFTSPEGKVYTYSYDKNKQPTQIAYDGRAIGLEYQATRLAKSTLPNGVANEYQYNTASWLSTITTKTGAGTLANSQYGFDKVGNITAIATEKGSHAYGYDPTSQLTSASHPALAAEAFSYDGTGNRNSGGYSSDENNELTASDTASFSYDRNGNATQKKAGERITGYTYNSADRLESVQLPDGSTATYTYDPFGRRIKKDLSGEVTYYAYADEGLIGEYDATGSLKKGYGWKPGGVWGTDPVFMVEDGDYYFYQNDHLGTPQKLSDGSGNVVWSAEYSAFGQAVVDPASTIENNLRFPGQYFDEETNLHYNWQRYYDPESGRYVQSDPLGLNAGDHNFYRYVQNNPNYNFDQTGLKCRTSDDKLNELLANTKNNFVLTNKVLVHTLEIDLGIKKLNSLTLVKMYLGGKVAKSVGTVTFMMAAKNFVRYGTIAVGNLTAANTIVSMAVNSAVTGAEVTAAFEGGIAAGSFLNAIYQTYFQNENADCPCH
jgi:large repetitive protein